MQQDQLERSKYEYHSIRDFSRQPIHYKRVHKLARKDAVPENCLQVVSFRKLDRQQVKELFKLLGPLKSVEEGQVMAKKGQKTLYVYLVQYKKQQDLLNAFRPRYFQAFIKPRVAPLAEQQDLELDEQQLKAKELIGKGFSILRNKHGQYKPDIQKAELKATKVEAKRRRKIEKSRAIEGYARAAAGLSAQVEAEVDQQDF